jgi:hypothetical protein
MREPTTTRAIPIWTIAVILTGAAGGAAGGGQDDAAAAREGHIAACLEAKEKALTCKEELADHFAAMAEPERRDKLRAKALQEIVEEGSGPMPARRAKCAGDHDANKRIGRLTPADLTAFDGCAREAPDCKARVKCWMAFWNKPRAAPAR